MMKPIKLKHKDKQGNIHESDYYPVPERLKYFREHYKGWSLTSKIWDYSGKTVIVMAVISDQFGIIRATGTAQEEEGSSFINKTSFIENCETSAWGRALANLGIGLDGEIASAEEYQNAEKNQEPATDEQQQKITQLLYNADISGANHARIENERHEYTPEIADMCINYLQANQKAGNIDTANGGYGQKEIIDKLDKVQQDTKK